MSPTRSAEETLKMLELTEANLVKVERLVKELDKLVSDGVDFSSDNGYDDARRRLHDVVTILPAIDGFSPEIEELDRSQIARRPDIREIGEPEAGIPLQGALEAPGRVINDYRYRLARKRRQLIRDTATGLISDIDRTLADVQEVTSDEERREDAPEPTLTTLRDFVNQLDTFLGSSVTRPARWSDLRRHLHFGLKGDLVDIRRLDWVSVKPSLDASLYAQDEAVPIPVSDLAELHALKPRTPIPTQLQWERLLPEDFERLLFAILTSEDSYHNVQWLMRPSAADRGRDISATRATEDALSGARHQLVIVQCKHWQAKSVRPQEIAALKDVVTLWEPPRVDVLIIATSGRFTQDAVQTIERHNTSNSALSIDMWAGTHLELLLAQRPWLISEFNLRG